MTKRCAVIITIVFALLIFTSCRLRSKAPAAPTATNEGTASLIARADQFYAQREDLKQLEQGIVLLRQAVANDPNDYDANWRLAKFNYYLGGHTQGEYKERAFREGINTGKAAVALQPNKPDG